MKRKISRRLVWPMLAVVLLSACSVPSFKMPILRGPPPAVGVETETLRLAQATAISGDYNAAVKLFERELVRNPNSVEALKGAGDSYSRLGQIRRAESVLLKANDLDSNDDEVLALLGRIKLTQRQPEEALEFYEDSLRKFQQNISALTGKGVSLDTMSRHAEAQKTYLIGLSYYPSNFVLRSNYALSLALTGQENQSIEILRELVRDPAAAPNVRGNLALVYALYGRENQARATLALDMDRKKIEENLVFYRGLRRSMKAGIPIGGLVF